MSKRNGSICESIIPILIIGGRNPRGKVAQNIVAAEYSLAHDSSGKNNPARSVAKRPTHKWLIRVEPINLANQMTSRSNNKCVGMAVAFLLCFGAAVNIGYAGTDDLDNRHRVLKYLETVTVPKFVITGEVRSEVIERLNQALHKADPHTQIEIIFVPPSPSLNIHEVEFARSFYINMDHCTVGQLMRIIGTNYVLDWKVSGNKVMAVQKVEY